MSTRSFVARGENAGDSIRFKGRYVHSDGYPSGVGQELGKMWTREGGDVEALLKVLLDDHYGWSYLNTEQPSIGGVEPRCDWSNFYSPGMTAYIMENTYDDRFVNVPGYGVAYTTNQGQSSPDDWIEGVFDTCTLTFDGGNWGTEYGYVFYKDMLWVLSVWEKRTIPVWLGRVSSMTDKDWDAVGYVLEYGEV